MALDRATQCVHAMDKFVVFVVLMVLSNHMVLFAHAFHPRTRLVLLQPVAAAANTYSMLYTDEGVAKASKPQVLAQQQSVAPPEAPPTNFKLQFVDSIFQIPIATLKAVNELVQTITRNLGAQVTTTGSVSSPAKASVVLDSTAHSSAPPPAVATAVKAKPAPAVAAAAAPATSLRFGDEGSDTAASAAAPVSVAPTSTARPVTHSDLVNGVTQ